ncbi:hypothetical protein ECO2947_23015 [Escherichia coli]|nr:hypothetical protein ECO2947_23015 [Escherichia coli]
MNNLMTTKQVADFCGVSVSTVLRWNSVNRRTGTRNTGLTFQILILNPAQINGHHARYTGLLELLSDGY